MDTHSLILPLSFLRTCSITYVVTNSFLFIVTPLALMTPEEQYLAQRQAQNEADLIPADTIDPYQFVAALWNEAYEQGKWFRRVDLHTALFLFSAETKTAMFEFSFLDSHWLDNYFHPSQNGRAYSQLVLGGTRSTH